MMIMLMVMVLVMWIGIPRHLPVLAKYQYCHVRPDFDQIMTMVIFMIDNVNIEGIWIVRKLTSNASGWKTEATRS